MYLTGNKQECEDRQDELDESEDSDTSVPLKRKVHTYVYRNVYTLHIYYYN